MKTYIANIIPRINNYSKKLDNLSLLTNQRWIVLNENSNQKEVYIFKRDNELLVSTDGIVEKGKWELVGAESLLIELNGVSILFNHGFMDNNILAIKIDNKEEYAIFINESQLGKGLNSIKSVNDFLYKKYFNTNELSQHELESNREFKRLFPIVMSILIIVTLFIFFILIK